MTPGARIQSTSELLEALWGGTVPAEQLTNKWLGRMRYAGSSDRRAIKKSFYAILRYRARLDWWIGYTGFNLTPNARRRLLAHLALIDKATPDAISRLFSGARYCPPPLSDPEKNMIRSLCGKDLGHPHMPLPVTYEFPAWMEESLYALWGKRLHKELTALNRVAAVDLRVNTLKATRQEAKSALKRASIETKETVLSPLGLRLIDNSRLSETSAFKEGLVEIQDEGSQLIALLCDAKPGMNVVDYCAGAGGKTLALAASMGRSSKVVGRLTACDISKSRLDRLRPRLKRAGVTGVKCRIINAHEDCWVAKQAGKIERVLVDVPCTGMGTWRRDPNMKWLITPMDLEKFINLQRHILTNAASMLRPGGKLIYATCSLLREENECQVGWFLDHHTNFRPIPIDKVWAETITSKLPTSGQNLRLTPATTKTDGFFCAVFVKIL